MRRDRAGLATVLLLLLLLLELLIRPPGSRQADESPAVHLVALRGPVSWVACLRWLWLQAGRLAGRASAEVVGEGRRPVPACSVPAGSHSSDGSKVLELN